ncbi:MAG: sugar-transfer associated ATP-grasp domain-containing protein [Candidatus Dojkabacteria bacterium]
MGILRIYKNRKKVLGLNDRYLKYIRMYNKKGSIAIADDKLLTKQILDKNEIPTPKLISVIEDYEQLRDFDWDSLPKSFVMKPVAGLEGGGIEIFYNRDKNDRWIRADKSRVSVNDLKRACQSILDGRFSLYQMPDRVMFEERIRPHKRFKYYTYKGTPDIRMIVFNNIPVMAMLRLPTRESKGKANLDKGALGLGIDMAKGATTNAIQGKSGQIELIPGTKLRTSGLKIPWWDRMLRFSIEAQRAANLNFAAIDFLIDREDGPVIVELNARPGLSIQLANAAGLRARLEKAANIKIPKVSKGVRLAKDLFGGEIEGEIESISGKEVVGIYENVRLIGRELQEVMTKAKIDTGADSTSIDKGLAQKLGFQDIIDEIDSRNIPQDLQRSEGLKLMEQLSSELTPKYEDLVDINFVRSSHGSSLRPSVRISLKLKDTKFETTATIFDRSKLTYPVIVGRKSLERFLIDPSKKLVKKSKPNTKVKGKKDEKTTDHQ